MFDLRSRLRFDLLYLASGFVERAAFAQVFVGATTSRNPPDHRPSIMLRPFLHAGVTCIGTDDILFAMQQVSDLHYISHIRRSAVDVMHQTRFSISTDMRLHAEEVLVALLGVDINHQAVLGFIGALNDFMLAVERQDRSDRPEGFFNRDAHFIGDIRYHARQAKLLPKL